MRRFCLGDVHGEYDLLLGLLKKVNFDYENDQLISLGDIVDRGPKSYECVELLLKIKNLIAIRGNHDATWYESTITGKNMLYSQGGRETLLSYTRNTGETDPTKIPETHKEFFKNQVNYFISEDHDLFIHGGYDRHFLIEGQDETTFYWDRDLFMSAMSFERMKSDYKFKNKDNFKTIYVGHTPTVYWTKEETIENGILVSLGDYITTPIKAANIWNIDTGAAKGPNFPLTIMDIDTSQYWQMFPHEVIK